MFKEIGITGGVLLASIRSGQSMGRIFEEATTAVVHPDGDVQPDFSMFTRDPRFEDVLAQTIENPAAVTLRGLAHHIDSSPQLEA